MSFVYRKNFIPFPITPLTAAQFAALANRKYYPVAVPLTKLCNWWWQAKTWKLAYSNSWSVGSDPGEQYGNSAFSGVLPSASCDLFAGNAVIPKPYTLTDTPNRLCRIPVVFSGPWYRPSFKLADNTSIAGTYNSNGSGLPDIPTTDTFGLSVFDLGSGVFPQPSYPQVVYVTDTGLYYPYLFFFVQGVAYQWQTIDDGSGMNLPSNGLTVDGVMIPGFEYLAFQTMSAVFTIDSSWPD